MRLHREKGFTLIELLVVMAIILILAGLVLTLIPYINKKIARTHAENEKTAIMAALEAYKADNGIYPDDANMGGTAGTYTPGYTDTLNAQKNGDPTQTVYINAGLVLYRALSGDRNLDRTLNSSDESVDINGAALSTPMVTVPQEYYHFDASLVLPAGGTGTVTGLIDAFGNSWGYSTIYQGDVASGSTTPRGYNPTYDLWSTGGIISGTSDTTTVQKQWIANWPIQGGQ